MKSFDDFWNGLDVQKLDAVINIAADEAKTADNAHVATAHILAVYVKALLAEYHEWLVSEVLPNQ